MREDCLYPELMAVLQLEDGTQYRDLSTIVAELAPLQVSIAKWPVGEDANLRVLLDRDRLTDAEKETILTSLDEYFQQLQTTAGYQSRDLIVLHPEIPNLDELLSKFDRTHTHSDDEVRYIIAGAGVFGFIRQDGSQIELTVEAEEYINVPANTEHWFHLTPERRTKAIRYFSGTAGWVPEYTDTPIRF
jgi:1,2-dihydroxy-3-keto-5-methylthiopentene dioxygenase